MSPLLGFAFPLALARCSLGFFLLQMVAVGQIRLCNLASRYPPPDTRKCLAVTAKDVVARTHRLLLRNAASACRRSTKPEGPEILVGHREARLPVRTCVDLLRLSDSFRRSLHCRRPRGRMPHGAALRPDPNRNLRDKSLEKTRPERLGSRTIEEPGANPRTFHKPPRSWLAKATDTAA
jgi:hypothetical protein